MTDIGYAFYLVFTGNIMFSWGLITPSDQTSALKARDIFASVFLAICFSVCYNFINSILLIPFGLISLSPILCAALISLGLFFSRFVLKFRIKNNDLAGDMTLPWLKNSLLFTVTALVSGNSDSGIPGFVLLSLASLIGYFCSTAFLNAIISRVELEPIPLSFRGNPIRLISAGLIAFAFSGIDVSFFIHILN